MQNQLNFIAPIAAPVKENYTTLKGLIQQLDAFHEKFDNIGTVHFARFLFLEKDTTYTEDVFTQFALITTYDGDFDDYVQDFVSEVDDLFNELFKLLEGGKKVTPVSNNVQAFIEYLRKYDRKTDHFYSSYPDLSVQDILANFS